MIITEKHPWIVHSKEFADLCKPLEIFQIHHVTYLKLFNDGSRISLSNKPEWLADYYGLNLYDSSLFEKRPSEYQAEFSVWIGEYDLEVYQHGKHYYNTYHSITINEPVEDGCEFYLFSTSQAHAKAIQYLSNHIDILYHFILYVKNRGQHLFQQQKSMRLWLPEIQKNPQSPEIDVNDVNDINYSEVMMNLRHKFLKETPIRQYAFKLDNDEKIQLTQRELHCISHLLNNKTAVEISAAMHISKRTVESHLENIKQKLQCENKPALIKLLQQDRLLRSVCHNLQHWGAHTHASLDTV